MGAAVEYYTVMKTNRNNGLQNVISLTITDWMTPFIPSTLLFLILPHSSLGSHFATENII
jgi:hypothetical protein